MLSFDTLLDCTFREDSFCSFPVTAEQSTEKSEVGVWNFVAQDEDFEVAADIRPTRCLVMDFEREPTVNDG